MRTEPIPTQTILNPTGGFLGGGFTHTMNLYRGCALGNSLCGLYCYAQWNPHHTLGHPWGGFLDIKTEFLEAYWVQYDHLKCPPRGEPKPLHHSQTHAMFNDLSLEVASVSKSIGYEDARWSPSSAKKARRPCSGSQQAWP